MVFGFLFALVDYIKLVRFHKSAAYNVLGYVVTSSWTKSILVLAKCLPWAFIIRHYSLWVNNDLILYCM